MSTLYITSKFIGEKSLESRPEDDFGFDYDNYGNFDILGDDPYKKIDVGVVSITQLIAKLKEMQTKGANYVGCDWHCDHQELDLYAYSLSKANSDEIQSYKNGLYHEIQKNKEKEITELEKRLEFLKKDLENSK
jgi:hypothetical protein